MTDLWVRERVQTVAWLRVLKGGGRGVRNVHLVMVSVDVACASFVSASIQGYPSCGDRRIKWK